MKIELKPRLTAPLEQTTEQYIDFWGAELYKDYCAAFGLQPMEYWAWEAATRERGINWWQQCLHLDMIKCLPPLDDYCMLLRDSHPVEVSGPRRYYHYAAHRMQEAKMTAKEAHEMLWHELGGQYDRDWYEAAVAHFDAARRRACCCRWASC